MGKWKELTSGKVIMNHDSGFMLIKPSGEYDHVPFCCPVCSLVMRDDLDLMAYQRNECCRDCELKWAEPFREKWRSGWRPGTRSDEKT